MKLVSKSLCTKDGSGSVVVTPEDAEDLWHLYNLILRGDSIRTSTVRKVVKEGVTGTASSVKKKMNLTLTVEKIEFDPSVATLRVKGVVSEESQNVRMGAYHTAEVEAQQKIRVEKACWDIIDLARLDEMTDDTHKAEVAAVLVGEGLAHICLLTSNMTITRSRIERPVPKKRKANQSAREKAMTNFYELVFQGMLRHVRWDVVKCVLIASPGFYREELQRYVLREATRLDKREILDNKSKIILCGASSAYKHALREVLSDPGLQNRLQDLKAFGETRALNQFYDMMRVDPDRTTYGEEEVMMATEKGAVETLMIVDTMFRAASVEERKKWARIVEMVKGGRGSVHMFSSQHMSGERLTQMCGVAAILRFPCPDVDPYADEEVVEEGDGSAPT